MTVENVYQWLEEVKDPEIPVLSLIDLGVITSVVVDNDKVEVEVTPTFVGCPALDIMKEDIIRVLKEHNAEQVNVKVSYRDPWSTTKLSEKGRAARRAAVYSRRLDQCAGGRRPHLVCGHIPGQYQRCKPRID